MCMRKRNRPVLITFLVVGFILPFSFSSVMAEKASVEEMDLVCQNWLTKIVALKGQWAEVTAPKIDKIEELTENDTLLARVYSISPEGYIVVPVIKELPPVKTYSDKGFFDIDQDFGFPEMIREVLLNRLRNFVNQFGSLEYAAKNDPNESALSNQVRRWNEIAVSAAEYKSNLDKPSAEAQSQAGPLTTTLWHQRYPYNNNCPYGDGGQCAVGCVATAASQILAYHRWPPEGEGSETYYWDGDNSCGGSTDRQFLSADFSDAYDWDNIVDSCSDCSTEELDALAELCYEVGVAFNMDYGYCGSAAFTQDAPRVFPDHFRYLDIIDQEDRRSHNVPSWFNTIKSEIDAGRPMQYAISMHSLIADGYAVDGDEYQIHMNYGWGGSYNAWYTIDNLYCDWSNCDPIREYLIRYIAPDKGVMFSADTTLGRAPLEVRFTGESELSVESWLWDFGDGDTSGVQSPAHIYDTPGAYDVKLEIYAEGETRSYIGTNFIIALEDTFRAGEAEGPMDSTLEIAVNIVNNLPLYRLQIPFEYGGGLDLNYLGYRTTGTRSADFEVIEYSNYDVDNKRFTLNCEAGESPDLEPGSATFIYLEFEIESFTPGIHTVSLIMDGYDEYEPWMYSHLADYRPALAPGQITYISCCVGTTGNINCSEEEEPDITDITRLIDFLYISNDELCCPDETDCNASGGDPDIADITALINYLYLTHNPLAECP